MRPSHNFGNASQGQQKQPELSTQGHVGVPPASQPPPAHDEPGNPENTVRNLEKIHHNSDDESDLSDDGGWSWYPDIKANEQAQWRRMALARRANPGGTNAGISPSLNGAIDSQLNGNSAKAIDGSDKFGESLVAASAANEKSDSTQASGTSYASVVNNEGTGHLLIKNIEKKFRRGPVKSTV